MEIIETKHGAVLVVSPKGRLDSATSPELDKLLRAKLAAGEHRLVIDLGALDYLSSAGLRVLLLAGKTVKAERGHIALCAVKAAVMEVFRLSGFDTIFTILPSIEQGVAKVGAGA